MAHETHETHEKKGPKRIWKAQNDFIFLDPLKISPPLFCFVGFVGFVGTNCFFEEDGARSLRRFTGQNGPRHSCAPKRAYADAA